MAHSAATNHRLMKGSAGWMLLACGAFAAIHSALASTAVKRAIERRVGKSAYRGLYRLGFIAQTAAMLGAGALWYFRLPDKALYHVRGSAAVLMRGVQTVSAIMAFEVFRELGLPSFLGLKRGAAFMRGEIAPPTPEAQCRMRAVHAAEGVQSGVARGKSITEACVLAPMPLRPRKLLL